MSEKRLLVPGNSIGTKNEMIFDINAISHGPPTHDGILIVCIEFIKIIPNKKVFKFVNLNFSVSIDNCKRFFNYNWSG